MVDAIRGLQPGLPADPSSTSAARPASSGASGAAFSDLLARASDNGLTFSGHAAKRIEQRGVPMDDERLRRLQSAVERAEAKGSKDSLILLHDLALVVSVKNHTVVTAVDEASQKERVFTNIDSVVIAE